jgi:hypothetical protein
MRVARFGRHCGSGKSDGVAVGVCHRRDELAASEVADRLQLSCAGGEQMRDAALDVLEVPVTARPGHAFALAVGVMWEMASNLLVLQRFSCVERVTGIEPALSAWE